MTLLQARDEKYLQGGDYAAWADDKRREERQIQIRKVLQENPQIGTIIRDGEDKFYVVVDRGSGTRPMKIREADTPEELVGLGV